MSRAFIFKGKENELSVSRKMSTDPFDGYYGNGIIELPYNLDWLARLLEHSNILSQCIEAMETNIDGLGFTLEPAFDFFDGDEKADADIITPHFHAFMFLNEIADTENIFEIIACKTTARKKYNVCFSVMSSQKSRCR